MGRLTTALLIGAVLSLGSAQATTTLTQLKGNAVSSTTCAVTITTNATGATHLMMGGTFGVAGAVISSVSGGGTWTLCGASCQISNATAGETSMAYLNAPTSGVTTVTFNASNTVGGCFVAEFSTTGTSFTLDTQGTICDVSSCASNCTSCASPVLTLAGTDALLSISSCGTTCSGTITNWTTLYEGGDGGAASVLNTATFNWAQSPTSTLVSSTLAFKENAGTTCTNFIALMGAGCK